MDHARGVPTVAGQNITAIMEAQQSPVKNYLMAYHTFLGLWVMNFIEGICTMTICGAFAGWYWTVPSKELSSTICCGRKSMYLKRVQKDKFPVLASLYRTRALSSWFNCIWVTHNCYCPIYSTCNGVHQQQNKGSSTEKQSC